MIFSETPEFTKDVKRLSKKWRSIPDDINAAKKYITPLYVSQADDVEVGVYRYDFFNGKRAAIITTDNAEVIKMRLDIANLGSDNKVRIIFVAMKTENSIQFIEMYAKNDKEREDQKRIKKYLDQIPK